MSGIKPVFNADAAEEYFTDLAVFYKNTANDIFRRDNEGRHVSEQMYSAEYQKYVGMQIAMREVLEYFAKYDLDHEPARGQWELIHVGVGHLWRCSHCKKDSLQASDFCPKCGADMREVEDA